MSSQIRIAFGKISVVSYFNEKIDLIDHIFRALEISKPSNLSRESSTVLSYLDVSKRDIGNHQYVIGFYGFALGENYQVIDENGKTITEQKYPRPPFKSKALFLIQDSGYLILEEKTESYIKPEKIKEALEATIREYSLNFSVEIDFLKLAENITMREFIDSLDVLSSIEFSEIRHSNPNEKSEFLDEATNARIDNIIESSTDKKGIDKYYKEFLNQIAHAENYAIIRKAEGLIKGSYRVFELVKGNIRLTVNVEDNKINTKISKMITVFEELLPKLSKK